VLFFEDSQFENISPSEPPKNLLKPRILQNSKWHSDCYFFIKQHQQIYSYQSGI